MAPSEQRLGKKDARKDVPLTVRRELAEFYEGYSGAQLKCVVTGSDVEVELHHLDERPAHSAGASNILPLKSNLNKNIDKRNKRILEDELMPEGLAHRSALYYSRGNYAYCYGCSVLGASLALNVPRNGRAGIKFYVDADRALFFCANALIGLRPLNRNKWAVSVLSNYLIPTLRKHRNEIERATLARVAMEIGSYFRDTACYENAKQFIELARSLIENEPRSARIRSLLARLWQHQGIIAIAEGDLSHARDCFKYSEEEAHDYYSVGLSNKTLYECQILLRGSDPPYDEIKSMLKALPSSTDPKFLTRWTDRELRLTEAQTDFQKGGARAKARAFDRLKSILTQDDGIVPTRAIFGAVLFGFAGEYSGYEEQVQGLVRALPRPFVTRGLEAFSLLKG